MSPREKFRTSTLSNGWNGIVDSVQFQSASELAMLHFLGTLQFPSNAENAAANEYRRQGAMAFLEVLLNLNTPNNQPKSNDRSNLQRT